MSEENFNENVNAGISENNENAVMNGNSENVVLNGNSENVVLNGNNDVSANIGGDAPRSNPTVAYTGNSYYSSAPSGAQTEVKIKPRKKEKNVFLIAAIALAAIAIILSVVIAILLNKINGNVGNQPTEYSSEHGTELGTEYVPVVVPEIPSDNDFTEGVTDTPTGEYEIPTEISTGETKLPEKLSVTEIAEKLNPGVVDIFVTTNTGTGSAVGMIYSEDGYILTCAHVISDAVTAKVTLWPDGTEYDAEIIGYDSLSEVGILKIAATGLTPVKFGDPSKLKLGEQLVSIGSPYSQALSHTITTGIVSGIRNSYTFTDLGLTLNVIQHTATINSGNSGGPLINEYGEVVGINSIKLTTYENICFAVRIDSVLDKANEIINTGKVSRPVLGITGETFSYFSIKGVYIQGVAAGYGAEAAGLRVGDIITSIDGVRVVSIQELQAAVSKHADGDVVELTILRDSSSLKVSVQLKNQ